MFDVLPVEDSADGWLIKRGHAGSDAEAVAALCLVASIDKIPVGPVYVMPPEAGGLSPESYDRARAHHCPPMGGAAP